MQMSSVIGAQHRKRAVELEILLLSTDMQQTLKIAFIDEFLLS